MLCWLVWNIDRVQGIFLCPVVSSVCILRIFFFFDVFFKKLCVSVTVRLSVTVLVIHSGAKIHTEDSSEYMYTVYLHTNTTCGFHRDQDCICEDTHIRHTVPEEPSLRRMAGAVRGWTAAECLPCGGVWTSRRSTEEQTKATEKNCNTCHLQFSILQINQIVQLPCINKIYIIAIRSLIIGVKNRLMSSTDFRTI